MGTRQQRYTVIAPLAHGGLGSIHQALDRVTGRTVALKRLRTEDVPEQHRQRIAIAFEREYFTLAQIAHPRVIQVFDYGIDETGPYYTMELLDGTDLHRSAPLGWQAACVILRDVGSSLALLHSRRLLHRDLSPKNVRCTTDGHAKLIDFGAMIPFGATSHLVGTPAYMAPESVYGLELDARADLFGLGALAYYALTRRHAYQPSRIVDMIEMWRRAPVPLRELVPDMPDALDRLVTALLSPDPMARPNSAAEVVGRLTAIAGLPAEDLSVVRAYLAAPALTARQRQLETWTAALTRARAGRGSTQLVCGAAGLGRSRFLATTRLEARLAGATSVHVSGAEHADRPHATVRALLVELAQQLPDLGDDVWSESSSRTFTSWLTALSARTCLAISIDDFDRCDAASAALLTELALCTREHRLLLTLSVRTTLGGALPRLVRPFAEQSDVLALNALNETEMTDLLRSVFGAVAHLGAVTQWVQRLCAGNPRAAMELAQHLVERGIATMRDGVWLLPETLHGIALPDSLEQAIEARFVTLSLAARRLAQTLSLVTGLAPLELSELAQLARSHSGDGQVYAALDELGAAELVVQAGERYVYRDQTVAGVVRGSLDAPAAQALHAHLAQMYLARAEVEVRYIAAHHLACAGNMDQACRVVEETHAPTDLSGLRSVFSRTRQGVELHEAVLQHLERTQASPRRLCRRRIVLVDLAHSVDPSLLRHAPAAIEQLMRDTGLVWRDELDPSLPLGEIGRQCFERALRTWQATPEAERGQHPLRALQDLAMLCVSMCAAYTRMWDRRGLLELPGYLAPFLPIPAVALIHSLLGIAIASVVTGHNVAEQCRQALALLAEPLVGVDAVMQQSARALARYYLGLDAALSSDPVALEHAEFLEQFPTYAAPAWHVRSLYHACAGDLDSMEDCRRRVELFALRDVDSEQFLKVGQLYTMLIALRTGDLLGLQRTLGEIDAEAARFPGWAPWQRVARGGYHWLRGELTLARTELEAGLALVAPDEHSAWQQLAATHLQVLVDLEQYGLAGELAEQVQAAITASSLRPAEPTELPIALALAEGHAGQLPRAIERMEDALDAVAGRAPGADLGLARLHETRARLALLQGDLAAFQPHADEAASHYRRLRRPGLVARLELLVQRAHAPAERKGPKTARMTKPEGLPS